MLTPLGADPIIERAMGAEVVAAWLRSQIITLRGDGPLYSLDLADAGEKKAVVPNRADRFKFKAATAGLPQALPPDLRPGPKGHKPQTPDY